MDCYWSLVTGNVKGLEGSSLVAIERILRWLFSVSISITDNKSKLYKEDSTKFWGMETLEIKPDENFDGSFIDVVNPLMHNVSTS